MASGTAASDPYENVGTVTAVDPFGTTVDDEDPSHYIGTVPGIEARRCPGSSTDGSDSRSPRV